MWVFWVVCAALWVRCVGLGACVSGCVEVVWGAEVVCQGLCGGGVAGCVELGVVAMCVRLCGCGVPGLANAVHVGLGLKIFFWISKKLPEKSKRTDVPPGFCGCGARAHIDVV